MSEIKFRPYFLIVKCTTQNFKKNLRKSILWTCLHLMAILTRHNTIPIFYDFSLIVSL